MNEIKDWEEDGKKFLRSQILFASLLSKMQGYVDFLLYKNGTKSHVFLILLQSSSANISRLSQVSSLIHILQQHALIKNSSTVNIPYIGNSTHLS